MTPFADEFQQKLRAFIRRRVSDTEDAADLQQDILLKLHNHAEKLDDEKVQAWVYKVARNAIIDYYRTRKIKVSAPEVLESLPHEPTEEAAGELLACMRNMMQSLPDDFRTALFMSDIDARPQQEIADSLGISLSGAKSRIQRGRQKLRSLMMECCHIELDKHGNVVEHICRNSECNCCH